MRNVYEISQCLCFSVVDNLDQQIMYNYTKDTCTIINEGIATNFNGLNVNQHFHLLKEMEEFLVLVVGL